MQTILLNCFFPSGVGLMPTSLDETTTVVHHSKINYHWHYGNQESKFHSNPGSHMYIKISTKPSILLILDYIWLYI